MCRSLSRNGPRTQGPVTGAHATTALLLLSNACCWWMGVVVDGCVSLVGGYSLRAWMSKQQLHRANIDYCASCHCFVFCFVGGGGLTSEDHHFSGVG